MRLNIRKYSDSAEENRSLGEEKKKKRRKIQLELIMESSAIAP